MSKNILIVNDNDEPIGSSTFEDLHKSGHSYRIIRIFLFNSKGQLLLQKRSSNVQFPNLWDQSVGGHVDENEDYETAALREASEEIGIPNLKLIQIKRYFQEETIEGIHMKRFNMLYEANSDQKVTFNPKEVSEIKFVSLKDLEEWIKKKPEDFTVGFKNAYKIYKEEKANSITD